MLDRVFFGVGSDPQRVTAQFDRRLLELGAIVHVELDANAKAISFSAKSSANTVPHSVAWIAPSEWYVRLTPKWSPEERFCQRVASLVSPSLDLERVRTQLTKASRDMRLEYQYKTSEYRNSRVNVIAAVADRLDVATRLQNESVGEALVQHWEPLYVYLLLTCFDLLGQPAAWMPFNSWLEATSSEPQRAQAINSTREMSDAVSISKHLYNAYESEYGVRNSFYRFLREVLPSVERDRLLASIDLLTNTNPPDIGEPKSLGNSEKERYLFDIRNSYTHRSQYVPGFYPPMHPMPINQGSRLYEQWFGQDTWTTVFTRNWPDLVFDTVRAGLASYISSI